MNPKQLKLVLFLLIGALLLSACGAQTSQTGGTQPAKLKIGYSVWVGYGPLFIARDKGYFKDEGLDIELVKVEDPKDRFAALSGKQLDGLVTTLDTSTLYWRSETPFASILGLDESSGGDGIIVRKELNIASVKDLKGKKIGVNVGSVSHFLLDYLLQQNGLTDADVSLVKMKQGDVPAALIAGQVDAGVTWEPHLSKAAKDPNLAILTTSKETPGLIVDTLILRRDVIAANQGVGTKLSRAWNKAVEYQKANPDDAAAIMQKGLGGFYEKPDDIKADLAGAKLFDKARNLEFFGGNGAGTAIGTAKFAIDLWTKQGQITTPIKPEDLVDGSFLEK
ncbi:MAG TPA: ABC transporter substrate-binding protein [Roseiflexaceae bacterium]|nr:ABC transporter substrate-binding protein [Roseiflexaceae bacterium]